MKRNRLQSLGRPLGLALAGFMTLGLPAAADDAGLKERVLTRLKKAHLEEKGDITVSVKGEGVVLTGAVTTIAAQRDAEKTARKEARRVENRLRILAEDRSDAQIRAAVHRAILGYAQYSVFDSVAVGVEDGAVLLRGSVHQPYRRAEIERRVSEVEGVRAIRNEITVQPVSIFDDNLRYQLVRRIYGDDRFVQYANRPDPPVRIIVERGRVTLTGYVTSRVDQALLGHIARETLALAVDNQVKVEGEESKEPRGRRSDG